MYIMFLTVVCLCSVFGTLDGAILPSDPEPQQWREFMMSVNTKLQQLEGLLVKKDSRINDLETKLDNQISAFNQYVQRTDNVMTQKNGEIINLKQDIRDVATRQDKLSRDLDGRKSDDQSPEPEGSLYDIVIPRDQKNDESDQENFTQEIATAESGQRTSQIRRIVQTRVAPPTTVPVAFHAELTASKLIAKDVTVVYNHEALDQGHGYDPITGLYTTPESGTYVLTWTTLSYAHDQIQTLLIVNGAVRGTSWTDSEEIHDVHQTTAVVVVTLHQSDHVFVRVGENRGLLFSDGNYTRSTFSGWKLH